MERPRINIPLDFYDLITFVIAGLFTILLIGFPIYYYPELPNTLPSHFGIDGTADRYRYSQKGLLLSRPIVGTVMFTLLTLFIRNPHWNNFSKEISRENAERQYKLVTKLLRTLRMLISIFYFFIVLGSINIGLGNQEELNSYFLPAFLMSIFGSLGIYFYQVYKK